MQNIWQAATEILVKYRGRLEKEDKSKIACCNKYVNLFIEAARKSGQGSEERLTKIKYRGEVGKPVFVSLVKCNQAALIPLALESGYSIDAQDMESNTALHIVALNDMKEEIKFLLGLGANINVINNGGIDNIAVTPLGIAKHAWALSAIGIL